MDLVWRVSGAAAEFVARHGLEPLAAHGPSSFNLLVAEDLGSAMLDDSIAGFLAERGAALAELAETGGASELDLACFLEVGEEYSAGVGLSPSTLAALGAAGVALAVTIYLCEEE